MTSAPQRKTGFQLTTALGADALYFGKLSGRERLGEPFRYEFHMLSENGRIDFNELIGSPISLAMSADNSQTRYFSGIVTRFTHVGGVRSYDHYVAVVRPTLWLLKQTADCRIFQEQSIPDIIKSVLKEGGVAVKDSLTETYKPVDYCVQYRESDFDFVSRLMEQEGIYYHFLHSENHHDLVLVDSGSSHESIAGNSRVAFQHAGAGVRGVERLWEFQPSTVVTSGSVVLTDYDFEKPKASLEVRTQKHSAYDLEQGEVYDYPGKYRETGVGQSYSKIRLEGLQAEENLCHGEGNVPGLASGGLFTLESYFRVEDNIEYLIVQSDLEFEAVDFDEAADSDDESRNDENRGGAIDEQEVRGFRVKISAIPASIPFRSPLKTPRPTISGPHTAVVVGQKGEEIWTDKYGRIKVQFHWDRLGKKDANSTCWIRVAQGWAGANWGSVFIPRIGQEVVVSFLEGDPDRPLVTGNLYNADQMPPYALPAHMTQSGIKTRSTKGGNDQNFNELRFEDLKDAEEIYLHAERDFNRVVENNDTLKVGFDKKDKGNQTIDIYNDRTITLDQGNDKLEIKIGNRTVLIDKGDATLKIIEGKRTETIKGDDSLTVQSGNRIVEVKAGDDSLTVSQGNHSIKINAGKSTITAAQAIELIVGGSSIKINPQGITLKAAKVSIQGDMQVDVKSNLGVSIDGGLKLDAKGTMSTVQGQGMMTVKGGLVMIN